MFLGHFGVSMALKGTEKNASLGVLFLGVQFVDFVSPILGLMGIEKVNIVPNFTASTHLEMVYYPYSHSLVAAFFWALGAYLVFRYLLPSNTGNPHRVALVVAIAVASHWFVDLLVHTPDLPLFTDSSTKVGFGLWNYQHASYLAEVLFLALGLLIYLKSTQGSTRVGKYGMIIFVGILVIMSIYFIYGPPPVHSIEVMGISLMITYLIISMVAFRLDKKRN